MGVVFFFADMLVNLLYGNLSGEVIPLLRPLALLFPLKFVTQFSSSVLQALHQERKVLMAVTLAGGVSLVLNCALIPLMGAYGAVYAQVLSAMIMLVFLSRYVGQVFRGKPFLFQQESKGRENMLEIESVE